jgi:hypothetical protein
MLSPTLLRIAMVFSVGLNSDNAELSRSSRTRLRRHQHRLDDRMTGIWRVDCL